MLAFQAEIVYPCRASLFQPRFNLSAVPLSATEKNTSFNNWHKFSSLQIEECL